MCFSVTIVDETKKSDICKDQCECCKILKKMTVSEDICKDQCECCEILKKMTVSEDKGTINSQKLFLFIKTIFEKYTPAFLSDFFAGFKVGAKNWNQKSPLDN